MNGQYHLPITKGGERFLDIGKLKSGSFSLREESTPKASVNLHDLYEPDVLTLHPFFLRNFGGIPSGVMDLAKKPPLW